MKFISGTLLIRASMIRIGIVAVFAVILALSLYKLTISPPPWYDEGIIIQTAKNFSFSGGSFLRVAPDAQTGLLASTGFPVLGPESAIFHLFGYGFLQARVLMVFYILAFAAAAFLLVRELYGSKTALVSLLLLASFAQLYGNGKSVLGEVPGMFYFMLCLFALTKLEKGGFKDWRLYVLAGASAGLAVAAKPIFLLLLGAGGLTYLIYIRKIKLSIMPLGAGFIALALTLAAWAYLQYPSGTTLASIVNDYSNPYALKDISHVMLQNAQLFFTDTTPMYYLLLVLTLCASIALTVLRERRWPPIAETLVIIFALLTLFVFLRTAGWYRYLFIGFLALLPLLPVALRCVTAFAGAIVRMPALSKAVTPILCILIVFQFYQTLFNSWVADNYHSTRASGLEDYFSDFDPGTSLFIYNVPEAAIFLKSENYYQYLHINDALVVGEKELAVLAQGVPDFVILSASQWEKEKDTLRFSPYVESERFESYIILSSVRP